MKRKIISTLFALVLVTGFSLIPAVPAAADPSPDYAAVTLVADGAGLAEWSTDEARTGSYSVKLYSPGTADYGKVDMPLDMEFENLADFSVWVEGGAAEQALPLLDIKLEIDETATSVDLSADNGNNPGGASVDLSGAAVLLASQPGQSENLSATLMSDGDSETWEKYGTHTDADIDVGTGDYWSMFVWDAVGDYIGTFDYYTWDEIHDAFDGIATVQDVRVELRYPQDPTPVASTVYVDDIEISGVTYAMEPRVINIDTSEGFNTIQAAIDDPETVATHTIIVAAGTYTENIVIDESITLESVAGPATTTIASSAEGIPVSIKADGVTVEGFTVTGCRAEAPYGEQGAGIYLEAVDNCIIKDNILTNNYPVGINLFGGAHGDTLLEYPDNNLVTGNEITGWRDPVLGAGTSYGIKVKGTGNTISNNTISVANSAGIHVWSQEGDLDETSPPIDNVISGNTIFDIEDTTAHYRQMMAGIWFNSGDSNEISGNSIGDWVQAGIVLKDPGTWTWTTASHDNVISGNTITEGTSIGGGWFAHKGIVLIGVAAGKPLADNSITGNTITGKAVGLSFVNSPDNAVHFNNIVGNTAGLVSDTATLDAENNWWGNASGPVPATPPPGYDSYGDAVSTKVDPQPWLLEEVTEAVPEPPTFDKTLALKDKWTLVSTDKEVAAGTAWVGTTVLAGTDTILAYQYTPGSGFPQVTMATQLTSVDAYYIKTDGGGGVGINYSTSAPGVVTKTLGAGWNIISCAGETDAYKLLSQVRYVQIGEQQGVGITNLIGQASYNQYLPTSMSIPLVTEGEWVNISPSETPVPLKAFDGYWVYMNAAKSFGVIPD